ncbi:hypothetical protein [Rhodobacteraceae bacterium W635]|uniref:hypothetical protein n=1 Tax=Nioella halotolerans TaxID=2303578 RepID=UPI0011C1B08B
METKDPQKVFSIDTCFASIFGYGGPKPIDFIRKLPRASSRGDEFLISFGNRVYSVSISDTEIPHRGMTILGRHSEWPSPLMSFFQVSKRDDLCKTSSHLGVVLSDGETATVKVAERPKIRIQLTKIMQSFKFAMLRAKRVGFTDTEGTATVNWDPDKHGVVDVNLYLFGSNAVHAFYRFNEVIDFVYLCTDAGEGEKDSGGKPYYANDPDRSIPYDLERNQTELKYAWPVQEQEKAIVLIGNGKGTDLFHPSLTRFDFNEMSFEATSELDHNGQNLTFGEYLPTSEGFHFLQRSEEKGSFRYKFYSMENELETPSVDVCLSSKNDETTTSYSIIDGGFARILFLQRRFVPNDKSRCAESSSSIDVLDGCIGELAFRIDLPEGLKNIDITSVWVPEWKCLTSHGDGIIFGTSQGEILKYENKRFVYVIRSSIVDRFLWCSTNQSLIAFSKDDMPLAVRSRSGNWEAPLPEDTWNLPTSVNPSETLFEQTVGGGPAIRWLIPDTISSSPQKDIEREITQIPDRFNQSAGCFSYLVRENEIIRAEGNGKLSRATDGRTSSIIENDYGFLARTVCGTLHFFEKNGEAFSIENQGNPVNLRLAKRGYLATYDMETEKGWASMVSNLRTGKGLHLENPGTGALGSCWPSFYGNLVYCSRRNFYTSEYSVLVFGFEEEVWLSEFSFCHPVTDGFASETGFIAASGGGIYEIPVTGAI